MGVTCCNTPWLAWNTLKLTPLILACAGQLGRLKAHEWVSEWGLQPCFHFSRKQEGSAEEGGGPPHNYRALCSSLIKTNSSHERTEVIRGSPLKELVRERPHLFTVLVSRHFPLHRWVTCTTQVFSGRPPGSKRRAENTRVRERRRPDPHTHFIFNTRSNR